MIQGMWGQMDTLASERAQLRGFLELMETLLEQGEEEKGAMVELGDNGEVEEASNWREPNDSLHEFFQWYQTATLWSEGYYQASLGRKEEGPGESPTLRY